MDITVDQLFTMIGRLTVELEVLRAENARLAALIPPPPAPESEPA